MLGFTTALIDPEETFVTIRAATVVPDRVERYSMEEPMAKKLAELTDVDVNRVWNARRTAQGFESIDSAAEGEGILVRMSGRDGGPRLYQSDSNARLALGQELVADALRNGTLAPSDLHRHLQEADQLAPGVPKYLYPNPIAVDQIVDLHTYADGVRGLVTCVKLRNGAEACFEGSWFRELAKSIEQWLRSPKGPSS